MYVAPGARLLHPVHIAAQELYSEFAGLACGQVFLKFGGIE